MDGKYEVKIDFGDVVFRVETVEEDSWHGDDARVIIRVNGEKYSLTPEIAKKLSKALNLAAEVCEV